MSMNKFMHPRNIYRTPPNFKELAIKYPEFRKHSKQELSGKVTIDFKDPAALRALTTTLLLKDFELSVEIPLDRLVPTLPLRLNYLLWIEDLICASGLGSGAEVQGIDVGTGASCIYPLLAAKTKGWKILATEIDSDSVECAQRNVEKNNLSHLIEVRKVDKEVILNGVLDEGKRYTFTMCNPPFFGSEKEVIASDNRSMNRNPPNNSLTGSLGELVVDGGEVNFVKQMLDDSKKYGTLVSLYTTMVGHKSNLAVLKTAITEAGACNIGSYEFCQGRTTRWGLAWTYKDNVKTSVGGFVANKKSKIKPPFSYVLPKKEDQECTVDEVVTSLKAMAHQLEMECVQIKKNNKICALTLTAWKNTWAKQRHKRRLAQGKGRKPSDEECSSQSTCVANLEVIDDKGPSGECLAGKCIESQSPVPVKRPHLASDDSASRSASESQGPSHFTCLPEPSEKVSGSVSLLKASVVVKNVSSDIVLEMAWLEGICGRDAVHQVLQYFKNNLEC